MKNVTIALDDETHRNARIRAAELGTSLSALVKQYLEELAAGHAPRPAGVREMQVTYNAPPVDKAGPPWLINGKLSYTKDGKPRKPGAMRGKYRAPDIEDLGTPDWLIDIMESEDDFSDLLPFDESQLPPK